ncbi:hypothetical protein PILCRDRAFT_90793 [Piloderma croceum F 1598]|uniref:Uncharacterized protein n=1 Tax=Piloderma croceum (strain F 1598) TaxID=765440 RepID=A0A0C3EZP2_PILCF|nr:hypothetical protein PILCRDRAFT_90793 [Piloderma croceum F 1598]
MAQDMTPPLGASNRAPIQTSHLQLSRLCAIRGTESEELLLASRILTICSTHAPQQLDNFWVPSGTHQEVESKYISTFCPIGPHAPQQLDNCWVPSETHQGVESRFRLFALLGPMLPSNLTTAGYPQKRIRGSNLDFDFFLNSGAMLTDTYFYRQYIVHHPF